MTDEEGGNPHLKAAVLEVVANQMRDNDPPATRQTYDRLIRDGHSEDEARRLLGCVVLSEIFGVLKSGQPFNPERFVQALNGLPELPDD